IISKRALSALEIPPRIVALARMGFGSLVLAAFLFATGRMELLAGLRPEHFAWIGLSSVFLLAYVASWYVALKHARATTAAMVLVLGAPVTTLLSFTVLAQAVTPLQVAGMLLLAAGVAAGTGAFSLLAAPFARFVTGRGAAKARAGDRK
ncbi:MAG: EamA family transporter, partial [Candidatus Micrarchaeota archaeon]|nr:EamA family transporter [Candidatus Micrarchaeota archaeon]